MQSSIQTAPSRLSPYARMSPLTPREASSQVSQPAVQDTATLSGAETNSQPSTTGGWRKTGLSLGLALAGLGTLGAATPALAAQHHPQVQMQPRQQQFGRQGQVQQWGQQGRQQAPVFTPRPQVRQQAPVFTPQPQVRTEQRHYGQVNPGYVPQRQVPTQSYGRNYQIPQGGWVTRHHQDRPDLRTLVLPRYDNGFRHHNPRVVVIHDHYSDQWGPNWNANPFGFYSGNNFWMGFAIGESIAAHNYLAQPVFVYSPISSYQGAQILPPAGQAQFNDETQAQVAVLRALANPAQDPSQPVDPSAGIYHFEQNFDPSNGGQQSLQRVSPESGYNQLRKGQAIFFHPPNGEWEKIENLQDLRVYMYSSESRDQAPTQQFQAPSDYYQQR